MKAVEEKLRTFCKDCCKNPRTCGNNPLDCQSDPLAKHYFEQYEKTYGTMVGIAKGVLKNDAYTAG